MRAIILAATVAVGIGLIGISNASAAPANGVTINESANTNQSIVKVQHWRWGSHGRWHHRCHYRYRSWGWC